MALTVSESRRRDRERKALWRERRRSEGLPIVPQREPSSKTEIMRRLDRERKARWREQRQASGLPIAPISGECKVYARECSWCGNGYVGRSRNARFCSTTCRMRFRDSTPAARARHDGGHRGRARRFGVEYEPVNRRRVFERDGYVCGICCGSVAVEDASLDHIIPISKGGPHTYSNTQCAHLACNIAKGARVVEPEVRYADVRGREARQES